MLILVVHHIAVAKGVPALLAIFFVIVTRCGLAHFVIELLLRVPGRIV